MEGRPVNIEQLSTQIVAINDAIQILARSNVAFEHSRKEIEGLLQKTAKNDDRIREIESLIHQSCDLKAKEMGQQAKELYDYINTSKGEVKDFTKYVAGAIALTGSIVIGYVFNTMQSLNTEHSAYEAKQEEKNDKIFAELFGVMREIRNDLGSMKSDIAVLKTNQTHYQDTLHGHMKDEESKWRGKK